MGPSHRPRAPSCYGGAADDQLAADAEAIARADGVSLNETVKQVLSEAVERRRKDPEFKARLRRIIEEDRELLDRLAK